MNNTLIEMELDLDWEDDADAALEECAFTVQVGPDLRPLHLASLVARRALQQVARAHVLALLGHEPAQGPASRPQRLLQRMLAQSLLQVLCLPLQGKRSTEAVKAQLDAMQLQLEGEPSFWDLLRTAAGKRPGHPALQQARLQRLDDTERWVAQHELAALVRQFESAICLQSARPVAAPVVRNLVRTPVPWRASDPPLVMGRNGAWFGRDSMHPSELVNVQILGGTGSGKTASCVEPPMVALLNYAVDGLQTAMLVIDPKRELEARVRQVLAERGELDRLVVVGECPPMRFFPLGSPLNASERLAKCKAFGPLITPTGDGSFWHHLGMALLRDLVQLQTEVALRTAGGRLFDLMAQQLGSERVQTGTWGQIREILSWIRRGGMAKLKEASEVLERLARFSGVDCAAVNALKNYTKDDELFRQFTYACQSADPLVNALCNPDTAQFVDMDVLPDGSRAFTDIAALVEEGKVILFCPEAREGHRLAGKALKAKFFEAVFARQNLERPVAYVCDEAQRFITQDPESGEQNFLDRCRAYRAICVLASQSLSSMEHELGSDNAACTALDIISSNTPTKFILRTTDIRTTDWLRSILPGPDTPGPHVVDVRRPAQLRIGEGYSVFADGRWGLHRARLADLC